MSKQPATIDLVALIERHAPTRLRYAASTSGGEYWGMCPFCECGNDRFHVWPNAVPTPHYWCRHCLMRGDAIQFLRDYLSLSYREACDELDIDPGQAHTWQSSFMPYAFLDQPPPKQWSETAAIVVERAHQALLHAEWAKGYRAYLASRGITMESIERAKIGCTRLVNGRYFEMPFSAWGLNEQNLLPEHYKRGCVRVPDGLLFPHYVNGAIWKISVKRPFPEQSSMPVGRILGGRECLWNEDKLASGLPAIMAESFLDALSIEQSCADLVTAISTDGATSSRGKRCREKLASVPLVLQGFDNDQAGQAGATWWKDRLANCTRLVPTQKDPNAMLQSGCDMRAWVQSGLAASQDAGASISTEAHIDALYKESLPLVAGLADRCYCGAVVEYYTTKGTACCEHHYAQQEQLERLISESGESTPVEIASRAHTPGQPIYCPYSPVSLPALPRTTCPHHVLTERKGGLMVSVPCKGKPLDHGWCEVHKLSHELLNLGASLIYPRIELGVRAIPSGVMNWEGYAEVAPERQIKRDMLVIRSKHVHRGKESP